MPKASYHRIQFNYQNQPQRDAPLACRFINEAINVRNKYSISASTREKEGDGNLLSLGSDCEFEVWVNKGVYNIKTTQDITIQQPSSIAEFCKDYFRILDITNEGPVKTYSYWRLKILERKFILHSKLNQQLEMKDIRNAKKSTPVMKVDTHVHLETAMTRKHLALFIKDKVEQFPEEAVMETADGEIITHEAQEKAQAFTLTQVLRKLDLTVEALTNERVDVEAGNRFVQRFDEFKSKYNPFGFSELENIFLKTSNHIQGRYLAEITKELFARNEMGDATEYRLTIYGSEKNEWNLLARWAHDNKVESPHNRWLVQFPRIFKTFRWHKRINNFQEMLDNILITLYFKITLNPERDPVLFEFLKGVSGFDSVDDESNLNRMDKSYP